MSKFFSFMTGTVCGALVGAVVVLLVTPASGEELIAGVEERWRLARSEANKAMEERRAELEYRFQSAKQ